MNRIWDKYGNVKEELKNVILFIEKNARCKDKRIENSIKELIYSGGKLIRPAFVIIASHFGNYNKDKSTALAAVIEMFHMATLVHDDIIDDAKLRRGQETVQSKYGKDYAVYIGDYLFCVCFKIMASTSTLNSIKIDSKSMSKICLGEIEQLNSRFSSELSVKKYLNRVSGKTAELFSLALYIGAAESGCSSSINKRFWSIGHNIGMAFQIIDDILDYSGNSEAARKAVEVDIRQGIFTLPFLYAVQNNKSDFNPYFQKQSFSDKDVKELVVLVNNNKGVEMAKDIGYRYTKKALKFIEGLPENKYKYVLEEITKELLLREY